MSVYSYQLHGDAPQPPRDLRKVVARREKTQLQFEAAALTGFCADVMFMNATPAVKKQHSVKITVIDVA